MLDTTTTAPTAPTGTPATQSRRAAGLAALAGGGLALVGDYYHLFVMDERAEQMHSLGYRIHGFTLMAALVLFMLSAPVLARGHAALTRVALVLAVAGTTLVVGDIWAETVVVPGIVGPNPTLADAEIGGFHLAAVILAFAVFAVGWLLYGVAALRLRWCPRPVAWLVIVGAVLAFLPIGGSYVLLSVGLALVGLSAVRSER